MPEPGLSPPLHGSIRARRRGRVAWLAALALAMVGVAACGGPQAPDAALAAAPAATVAAVAPECAGGRADCDHSGANACETDLASSDTHCGSCGNACAAGGRCVHGNCRRQRLIAGHGRSFCAVIAGRTQCWGESLSLHGASLTRPVRVPEADGAVHLSVGFENACAVLSSGKVVCWGRDGAGELPGVEEAVEVEVGTSGTYVVTQGGDVQRFHGREAISLEALRLSDVVSVASGLSHDCALHGSGEVTCWGWITYLGSGPIPEEMDSDARIALMAKGARVKDLKDAVQITASYGATCALRKTGAVVCWGNLDREKEDHGNTAVPVPVAGLTDAVEVARNEGDINHDHACAVRTGGQIACWGNGERGATGSGVPGLREVAGVKGILDGTAVAAGIQVSCALRASGEAVCWGSAQGGALGNGTTSDPARPVRVPGVSGSIAVGLGEGYSCSLDGAGQITCWGRPDAYSAPEKRGIPPRVVSTGGKHASLFGSTRSICALDDKGVATCFDPSGVRPRETLSGLGPLRSIRRETPVGVALTRSGQVLLVGPDGVSKQPITGLSDAVSVAQATGYGDRVCAVRKSGKVACAKYSRQMFDTPTSAKASPPRAVEVEGISDAAAIVFGGPELGVLHRSGDVTLFVESDLDRPPPDKGAPGRLTPRLARWAGVQAAALTGLRSGICALRKDGRAACWGSNYSGALGVGDDEPRKEPTVIEGLPELVSIGSAPGSHTCAAAKDGAVFCWGRGDHDEIGQEPPSFVFTPVPVLPPL